MITPYDNGFSQVFQAQSPLAVQTCHNQFQFLGYMDWKEPDLLSKD